MNSWNAAMNKLTSQAELKDVSFIRFPSLEKSEMTVNHEIINLDENVELEI